MLKAHYKGVLYECPECDAIFKNECYLNDHIKDHKKGEATCAVCGKKYSGETTLRRHWYDKHQAELGSYSQWKKQPKKTIQVKEEVF